jgi:hypothetical protein
VSNFVELELQALLEVEQFKSLRVERQADDVHSQSHQNKVRGLSLPICSPDRPGGSIFPPFT